MRWYTALLAAWTVTLARGDDISVDGACNLVISSYCSSVSAGDARLAHCLIESFKTNGATMAITPECKGEVLNVLKKAKGGHATTPTTQKKAPTPTTQKKAPTMTSQANNPAVQMKCMSQVKEKCVGRPRDEIHECVREHFAEFSFECQAMAKTHNKGR